MPNNVPTHLKARFERCLEAVVASGQDKDAAYAICYTTVVEAPRRLLNIMQSAAHLTIPTVPLSEAQFEGGLTVADYTPRHRALADALRQRGVLEAGARHTQREFQIIEQVIQLMTELYGEIGDLGAFIDKVTGVTEALGEATVVDHLISIIHSKFTEEADYLVGAGARLDQDERIFLSHAIGCALDAFNACIDAERPYLRDRLLYDVTHPTDGEVTPAGLLSADDLLSSEPEDAFELMAAARKPVAESAQPPVDRALTETLNGQFSIDATQRHPDGSFILGGHVIVEGRSDNGNRYTVDALRTIPPVFAGQYIFIDHPSLSEATDRPERSEYDKVGLLPTSPADFYIDVVKNGKHAGKQAAFFRNGKLSQTVEWLATRIKEGISGEMSVNAHGRGREADDGSGEFIVEAFVPNPLTSLDFVTKGAAGGQAQLLESQRRLHESLLPLAALTLDQLVEARPDLVAALSARALSGARETFAQEANRMAEFKLSETQKQIVRLNAALRKAHRAARHTEADRVVGEALAGSSLPAETQTRVRSLVEAVVKRFVEADPQAEPPGELAPTGPDLNAGDPATIELPPDVAELPKDAQGIWLETYVTELPKGEARAVNLAWAAVYAAGWVKGDQGWYTEQATQPAVPAEALPLAPMETTASLRAAIAGIIASEKAYLAKVSEAGRVTTMGGGGSPEAPAATSNADAKLAEAYQGWGLSKQQAEVAVQGR